MHPQTSEADGDGKYLGDQLASALPVRTWRLPDAPMGAQHTRNTGFKGGQSVETQGPCLTVPSLLCGSPGRAGQQESAVAEQETEKEGPCFVQSSCQMDL